MTGTGAVVTLTTDFGTSGYHAGAMKGVLLSAQRDLTVVDLCHGIPAGDVAAGAWTLLWNWRFFPAGTVHVAVVDPGVGTSRRALAGSAGGYFFVGPDNGLLLPAAAAAGGGEFCLLSVPETASATFHGRDVFAPAAALLARGVPPAELGPPVTDPVKLELPRPRTAPDGSLKGEVIAIDPFGNLVTSIMAADLPRDPGAPGLQATLRNTAAVLRRSYGDGAEGEAVAVTNSSGHLEIAVNGGRADRVLRAAVGDTVTLRTSGG